MMRIIVFVLITSVMAGCKGEKKDHPQEPIGTSEISSIQDEKSTIELDEYDNEESRIVEGISEVILRNPSLEERNQDTLFINYNYFEKPLKNYQDSVNQFLAKLVHRDLWGEGACNFTDSTFFKERLNSFKKEYDQSVIDGYGNVIWSYEGNIQIDDSRTKIAELSYSYYVYAGGAHGSGAWVNVYFDKTTGKRLEPVDFFNDLDEVIEIAEKYFRKNHGIRPDDDLDMMGYWFDHNKFHLSENFSIDENGLHLYYNSYEIASYAQGPTDVNIPMKEIQHLISDKIGL